MEQIVFVILHYKVLTVTEESIKFILKQNYDNIKIIVVDNFSNNSSIEALKNKFDNNDKLEFVLLERNYGFAKANDIGYSIAKHKYNASYIVVMNNDVMIKDDQFCNKLLMLNLPEQIGVVGPDILTLNEEHQNPLKACIITKTQLKKAISVTKFKLVLVPLFYKLKRKKEKINVTFIKTSQRNVPLHGACIIFLRPFIQKFEFAFYPDTFLYGEEDILFYLARKQGIEFLYEPLLKVQHMEDVSTNSISVNRKNKRIFQLKHSLKSLTILKSLMEDF